MSAGKTAQDAPKDKPNDQGARDFYTHPRDKAHVIVILLRAAATTEPVGMAIEPIAAHQDHHEPGNDYVARFTYAVGETQDKLFASVFEMPFDMLFMRTRNDQQMAVSIADLLTELLKHKHELQDPELEIDTVIGADGPSQSLADLLRQFQRVDTRTVRKN